MRSGPMQREQIKERQHADYASYERWRRETDAMTDVSERLAAPMKNSFEYLLGDDGHLYFQGQSLENVFDDGIRRASELAAFDSRYQVELDRRLIERQEYDDMRRLALGEDDDPDELHVFSLTPDAVLAGLDLGAYDIKRRKIMHRKLTRTDHGVMATSTSLDGGDRDALAYASARLGQTITPDMSSEQALSVRIWRHSDMVIDVRKEYDCYLSATYGGKWFGGRQDSPVLDALEFVKSHPDLLADFMKISQGMSRRSSDYELALQNYTAAVSRRLRGDADLTSQADAGAAARASGEKLDGGDCPTGANLTASQSLEKLGLGNRLFTDGICRVCLKNKKVGECQVCLGCELADNNGYDLNEINRRAKRERAARKVASRVLKPETIMSKKPNDKLSRQAIIKLRYGAHAATRHEVVIGGKDQIIYDRRNGEIISVS